MEKYEDIINHAHHISTAHKQMTMYNRAAQFSPFAALTGYDDDVKEAGRIVGKEKLLGEDQIEKLNSTIAWLKEHSKEKPLVKVTYFVPDKRKSGGEYKNEELNVRLVDEVQKFIAFTNNRKISLDLITNIEKLSN